MNKIYINSKKKELNKPLIVVLRYFFFRQLLTFAAVVSTNIVQPAYFLESLYDVSLIRKRAL